MNLAQMLAERMKSPGAMAAFQDVTSNPQARAGVGDGMTGADKQEPFPLDTGGVDDEPQSGNEHESGDAGLGMMEAAHALSHGKKKAALDKAIKHGRSKGAKHMPHMNGGHADPGKKK